MNIGKKLIPCEKVSKTGLSKIYARNTQNAGLCGRPKYLPFQAEVCECLADYLGKQKVKAGYVPKLSHPLVLPVHHLTRIDPADAAQLDHQRMRKWKTFQTGHHKR